MKHSVSLAVMIASLSAPVWAGSYGLVIAPSEQQISRMFNGRRGTLDAGKAASVAMMEPTPAAKRIELIVSAQNSGAAPFDFGPENVTIRLANGTVIPMLTYDQLARQERRRAGWASFAAGMAAASRSMNASNAGYTSGTATYTGNSFGRVGATPFNAYSNGTMNYSGYDATAASIARSQADNQNAAEFAALAQRKAAGQVALAGVFRTTTVEPGAMQQGMVSFDLPKTTKPGKEPIPVTVVIAVAGEEHTFAGQLVQVP